MTDIRQWLEQIELGKYADLLAENEIDVSILPRLSEDDLKELGLPLGARRKLQVAIEQLSEATPEPGSKSTASPRIHFGEAERRQLTVMFCDLVGSTALSQRLDLEELREVNRAFQDAVKEAVDHYEGYIARYMGDGVLVYFGYPKAHEDEAERAVRAGLGIVEAMEALNAGVRQEKGVELKVRVGIATGPVVVGDLIGEGASQENAVVGVTPSLAARLQAMAGPNAVVIGASTQQLVEGLFDCENLGPQRLKGISEHVTAYLVRGGSDVPSRFEATSAQRLTSLVGRELEVSLLLNRWEQAKDGEGQVVLLSGEAGIGKSRVVWDFRQLFQDEPHNRVLYYGSQYHQNSALHPAINQLERGLRFEKDDDYAQRLDKLETALSELGLSLAEYAPPLASLMSLPADDRYPQLELAPEQLKQKIFGAICSMVEAMATQQPVLMVVEDVHWIDPSTLDLITFLIEQLRSVRFYLIITCRLEFESPWRMHTHVTSLTLNRLGKKHSDQMINSITGDKALPEEIRDQITTRTDGVPLFIEELTKAILESGLVQDVGDRYALSGFLPPLEIPASLQDSLMARLDRLGIVKEVAQLAAMLGRTFAYELLRAVSELNDIELEAALAQLVRADLIQPCGVPPDVIYSFKHVLVQDAAYQSLLTTTRQQYHHRIAGVLEKQFSNTAETEPELLAYHYSEAQLPEKAVVYWQRSGRRAVERSAHLEGINHLTKGLKILKTLPENTNRAQLELLLQTTLATALIAAKGYAAIGVEQAYTRALELCKQMEDKSRLLQVLLGLGAFQTAKANLDSARELGEQSFNLAEQMSESRRIVQARYALGISLFHLGKFKIALEHFQQGTVLYRPKYYHPRTLQDAGVSCLSYTGWTLWRLGYPDQALERSHEALGLAKKLSHPHSLAFALDYAAALHQFRGERQEAKEVAEAEASHCAKFGFPYWVTRASILQGWVLAEDEQEEQKESGIRQMRQGLDTLRAAGVELLVPYVLGLLANAYGKAKYVEEGLSMVAEALAVAKKNKERHYEAELYRINGELLAKSTEEAKAEHCYKQAIEIAREQSAKSFELRASKSLSSIWHSQGKRAEAYELLAPIYSWFTEGFETADLKAAKTLLDKLM